jgi:ABC-type nickel/cobalt efflux system permease component RcnA
MAILAKRFLRIAFLLVALAVCRPASAHPMGNFSVNHYTRITLETDRIRVCYLIDLAEIPTYQELQRANIPTNTIDPNSPTVTDYVAARSVELGKGLILNVDGKAVLLRLVSSGVIFPPGAGGLPTMKMGFDYEAVYPTTIDRRRIDIVYVDNNYPGHSGWKEITALASAGSLLRSSVPATDRSGKLSNYPTDLLTNPPQDLEATVVAFLPPLPAETTPAQPLTLPRADTHLIFARTDELDRATSQHGNMQKASAGSNVAHFHEPSQHTVASSTTVHLEANRQPTPRSRFTELIQAQNLSAWFLFTASLIAICLGGLHALEPGHGKTIVAAYLVGSRGTARHAFLLGLIVTVAHTAGVFALGAITLYASRYIVPEHLYPWLGALSGVTIAVVGCYMLLRRLTGTASDHSHVPGASGGHFTFWKRPANRAIEGNPTQSDANPKQSVSLTQLVTLGITGGIIPCPAALIVLLSAFALHRIGLGFFLIVAFSLGLAGVLIGFGMLMVYARRFMAHLAFDGPFARRWLPAASAAFIAVLGLMLAVQSLHSAHLDAGLLSKERLGPILFVTGLGLILGIRHSTDADHVVAISTIVSKQRSIRNAAMIGSIWGLGHTITIFVVGSLIILFGVEIPPRLGLSMEFSVAVMLILLGALNLTGVIHKITKSLTPAMAGPLSTSPSTSLKAKSIIDQSIDRLGLYQCLRPLAIGLIHGLAGSAAVALLVLSTIHSPVWASIYLLIFGAGTMVGMMSMTAAIAAPLSFGGDRFAKLGRYLGAASGTASLCFGSFLVYQLGFLGGLFTSHPHWTPR